MKVRQVVGVLASFAAVGIASARYQSVRNLPVSTVSELEATRPYAIAPIGGRFTLDLSFASETKYTLIVSSHGDSNSSYAIDLRSESTAIARPMHGRLIRPLTQRRKTALPAWPSAPEGVVASTSSEKQSEAPRRIRAFFLHVTDGSLDDPLQYARVPARLIRTGRRVRVYLDAQQNQRELRPGVVDEIVRVFDEEIAPKSRRWFGTCRDVDGDGTFLILLSPWLNRLRGGRVSLGGFVRGSDFRSDARPPFGNRCDMMCLNSNVVPGRNLKALLAHEFTHAIAFSRRLRPNARRRSFPEEEDWLNEAIAHLAENLHDAGWSNLDHRIAEYLDSPNSYPLVVPDYYSARLWRNHGCRGATYLFLRWCVDQFGERILANLIDSPATGRNSLELITGMPFHELFRRWSIAVSGDAAVDRYRSIPLRGRLGRERLTGSRRVNWNVESGPKTLTLRGTAAAFVSLRTSGGDSTQSVRISAPPEARLQVTVIRLSAGGTSEGKRERVTQGRE